MSFNEYIILINILVFTYAFIITLTANSPADNKTGTVTGKTAKSLPVPLGLLRTVPTLN